MGCHLSCLPKHSVSSDDSAGKNMVTRENRQKSRISFVYIKESTLAAACHSYCEKVHIVKRLLCSHPRPLGHFLHELVEHAPASVEDSPHLTRTCDPPTCPECLLLSGHKESHGGSR